MPPLRIELHNPVNEQWVPVGELQPGDPDGSISDNHANGRDVYIFGVDPIEDRAYIKKSAYGIDTAEALTRAINTSHFIEVTYLACGESHDMEVKTDISSHPRKIRLTYF